MRPCEFRPCNQDHDGQTTAEWNGATFYVCCNEHKYALLQQKEAMVRKAAADIVSIILASGRPLKAAS